MIESARNVVDVDVVIVGAGLSGIGAAYHLQTKLPGKSFVLLEARDALGGTWDLFRYPGIRSDSDMFTLGFPFRPWTSDKTIADGPSILAYLRETAEAYGIDRKIRFRHRVEGARWSSDDAKWTLDVRVLGDSGAPGELVTYRAAFVVVCAGYYDYEEGYTPDFAGRDRFKGAIVHPQKWTDDVVYEGKRVIVVGSGATAMTLVPELAKKAAHVTMLQRSPTYVLSRPSRDALAAKLSRWMPEKAAYRATRWKNIALSTAFYKFCRRFPDAAKRLLKKGVRQGVGEAFDVETHFTPRYAPWDQRLCVVPDGDLFEALARGRASVVTGEIETFTEQGVRLRSGEELAADLVVTATGLRLKLLGGIVLDVDGKRVASADTLLYKGVMLSDVPNLAMMIGYTNASWTLKCDLACDYVCRLLALMAEKGFTTAVPRAGAHVQRRPLLDLSAGYIRRDEERLIKQGTEPPWCLHQNYALDLLTLRRSPIEDGVLELTRIEPRRASAAARPRTRAAGA